MGSVLTIVLPVFTLIAIGWAAGRTNYFASDAVRHINEYTFWLAVPAFLFRTMAKAELTELPIRLWLAFFGAAAVTWIMATLMVKRLLHRPAVDAPSIAMSSCFGNVVMLGIPITYAAFGDSAGGPAAMLVSLHTPGLFLVATLHQVLVAEGARRSLAGILRELAAEVTRNPIIMAIIAGTIWRLTGLGLNPAVDRVLLLLGQSSVATALVGLGLSLVNFAIKGQVPTLSMILMLKLVAMPAMAWLLAFHVLDLAPVAAAVVVLFAAMPSGANAYVFATRHGHAENSASGAVALGTALSVITASYLVGVLGLR